MFWMEFSTDNSAFCEDIAAETARIIAEVALKVAAGDDKGHCFDINGNKVGRWSLTADESE